jgi:hypothetical protein
MTPRARIGTLRQAQGRSAAQTQKSMSQTYKESSMKKTQNPLKNDSRVFLRLNPVIARLLQIDNHAVQPQADG